MIIYNSARSVLNSMGYGFVVRYQSYKVNTKECVLPVSDNFNNTNTAKLPNGEEIEVLRNYALQKIV